MVAKARICGFWRAGHPKAGDAASQETLPETRKLRGGLRNLKARRLGSTRKDLCNIRKFWRENEPFLASPADRKLAHASAHPWLCPAGPRHIAGRADRLVATSQHLIDRNGKPIGTDFSNVYAAVLTLSGKAPDAYDPKLQHAAEIAVFEGRDVPFFGWHYPPFFLMIAACLR
jgi:hypothetical protein